MKHFRFALTGDSKKCFVQKQKCPVIQQASRSPILSIAAFITWRFPKMPPPINIPNPPEQILIFQQYKPAEVISSHPYYDIWADYITQCLLQRRAYYHQQTLFVQIPLSQLSIQELISSPPTLFNEIEMTKNKGQYDTLDRLKELFGLDENIGFKNKRVGLFINITGNLSNDIFQPRINYPALLLGLFFNNEQWHIFNILKTQPEEIPQVQQLLMFDCIIMSGGPLSVLDRHPLVQKSIQTLMKAYDQSEKLKIFGICFGHQLIAQYHKAKVVKSQRKRGIQNIQFDQSIIKQYDFLKPLQDLNKQDLNKLQLCQNHEDYVEQIPKGFKLVAKSNSCKVESLVSQNGRIFSTQWHSEYTNIYAKVYNARILNYYKQMKFASCYEKVDQQIQEQNVIDAVSLRQCVRNFISGN